jgi:PAS domain S-box-containing protein
MPTTSLTTPHRWPPRLVTAAGTYAIFGGVITLVGWATDSQRLTDWKNDGISMFPNTAVCAALSGLALVLNSVPGRRWPAAARAIPSVVGLIGALTLFEHVTGINLGIDTLVIKRAWGQLAAAAPMRMGPPASMSFLLLGTALLLLHFGPRARGASVALGIATTAVATLSLTGHLYGAEQMYTLPRLTGIAMQTASMILVLGIGVIANVPEREPMRTLLDTGAAAMLARRSLPVLIVLPITLGWLRVLAQTHGLVDTAFGAASRTVVEIAILTAVLWRAVSKIRTQEQARQHTEAEHQRGQALFAAIIQTSNDAIVSKSLDGIVTSWNAGAERIFGYSADEMVGQSILRIVPPERAAEVARFLAAIGRGERIDHFESERVRKDGQRINVSLTISPVRDATGTIIGASKIARDVTQQRRAEQRLYEVEQQARVAAEDASRAKDQFLAMLSHELRNPLSAVRNAVTTAALNPAGSQRALEIALRGTDQLTRLVDDLLEVTRMTQGRITLRTETIAFDAIVERSVEAARPLFDERSVTLTLSRSPRSIELHGDATRLEQVVGNLLANAVRYTEPGGTVTVTLEYADHQAILRVRDTGIGIAPELLNRIFDLFVQAEQALDRRPGGLGIGLTLVKALVEMHGGQVTAHSEGVGRGAEFTVRLPATMREQQPSPEPALPQPVRTATARVLIVEDNADAAESLMMLLELLGLRVRIAADGPAALEAARANVPDVMLIDIGLPGMNGYELAQQIRQDATLRGVTLVALTGYGYEEDRQRALAAGFDYHLVKPVDPAKLDKLVADIAPAKPTVH